MIWVSGCKSRICPCLLWGHSHRQGLARPGPLMLCGPLAPSALSPGALGLGLLRYSICADGQMLRTDAKGDAVS